MATLRMIPCPGTDFTLGEQVVTEEEAETVRKELGAEDVEARRRLLARRALARLGTRFPTFTAGGLR